MARLRVGCGLTVLVGIGDHSLRLHGAVDPVGEGGDARIYARVERVAALRTPAHDAELHVAASHRARRRHERAARVAEALILAAARTRGADLGVAHGESWNVERLVNRFALPRIDHLDIDLVQFARRVELLLLEKFAFGQAPAAGHDVDGVLERLEVPDCPPPGDGDLGPGDIDALVDVRIGNGDGGCIGDGLLELEQTEIGLVTLEVVGVDDNLLAFDLGGLGAVVGTVADHDFLGIEKAVSSGQHPLRGDDRAAAEADLVIHGAVDADLPGIFALIDRATSDDHLGVVGGKSRLTNDAGQRGQQKNFRYNSIDSRHSISPDTGFDVIEGLP